MGTTKSRRRNFRSPKNEGDRQEEACAPHDGSHGAGVKGPGLDRRPGEEEARSGDEEDGPEPDEAQDHTEHEETVAQVSKAMPWLHHLGPVPRHPVQKHELAAAAQPGQEDSKGKAHQQNRRPHGQDEGEVLRDPRYDFLELVSLASPEGVAPGVSAAALPKGSQERAEAEREPFTQIEGSEEHGLGPIQGRLDGVHDRKGAANFVHDSTLRLAVRGIKRVGVTRGPPLYNLFFVQSAARPPWEDFRERL